MTPHDDATLTAAALLHARTNGCTCDPDITIEHAADGLTFARCAHDTTCPLILARHAPDN